MEGIKKRKRLIALARKEQKKDIEECVKFGIRVDYSNLLYDKWIKQNENKN